MVSLEKCDHKYLLINQNHHGVGVTIDSQIFGSRKFVIIRAEERISWTQTQIEVSGKTDFLTYVSVRAWRKKFLESFSPSFLLSLQTFWLEMEMCHFHKGVRKESFYPTPFGRGKKEFYSFFRGFPEWKPIGNIEGKNGSVLDWIEIAGDKTFFIYLCRKKNLLLGSENMDVFLCFSRATEKNISPRLQTKDR